MIQSSYYGLCNPALDGDIGYNNLNQMLPIAPGSFCGYVPGVTGTMYGIGHLGQLQQDSVCISNKQARKDNNFWNNFWEITLIGTGIAVGLKYGKGAITKLCNGIKSIGNKIGSWFKK